MTQYRACARTALLLLAFACVLLAGSARAAEEKSPGLDAPLKLGSVWLRTFDEAAAAAKKEGKPILLLFQEAPACVACEGAGSDSFLDAKVLEAAADFVTVTVYTNREGKDAEALKRFHESRQKTAVIRLVDAEGKDLVPRADGIEPAATLERMKAALEKAKEAKQEAAEKREGRTP